MGTKLQRTGFLRLPQVLQLIPVCRATWWNGCKSGRFPKPVKLGPRTTAWRAEDIAELVERVGTHAGKLVLKCPCCGEEFETLGSQPENVEAGHE